MNVQQITNFVINDSDLNQIAVKQEFLPDVQHYKITFSVTYNQSPFSTSQLVSKESFESLAYRVLVYKYLKDSLRNYLGSTNQDSIFSDILCPDAELDNSKWIKSGF